MGLDAKALVDAFAAVQKLAPLPAIFFSADAGESLPLLPSDAHRQMFHVPCCAVVAAVEGRGMLYRECLLFSAFGTWHGCGAGRLSEGTRHQLQATSAHGTSPQPMVPSVLML